MELLKLSRVTIVPTPMAIPSVRKIAFPLRRFRFANASVLILITFQTFRPLEQFRPTFQITGSDQQLVSLNRSGNAIRIAAACGFVDQSRGEMLPAVVAHHVVAFLVIAFLLAIANDASIGSRTIDAVRALNHKEPNRLPA